MPGRSTVIAWYLPHYHVGEPRFADTHHLGWSHWDLVRQARPRFDGHRQPQQPVWGEEQDADADCMARKIDTAVLHGIDTFLFHWYHDDDGPWFTGAVDRGFLGARNRGRMRYALCWANHPWLAAHPAPADGPAPVRLPGTVGEEVFDAIVDHLVEHHFRQPNYLTVDGRPFLVIYDLANLLRSFGDIPATNAAIARLRERTVAAGFPGLHLCGLAWKPVILPAGSVAVEPAALVAALGLDSVTTRSWVHHAHFRDFPTEDYRWLTNRYLGWVQSAIADFTVPYLPCVSQGWDPTPHCHPEADFLPMGYPYLPVLTGNDPDAFREALQSVQYLLDDRPDHPGLMLLDSWNDWSQGSRLEPEAEHGMAYLDAVKQVFGSAVG